MIWLTWRQMRIEAWIGGLALIALLVFLVWTGLDISSAYRDATQAACLASDSTDPECRDAAANFLNRYRSINNLTAWLILVPFLIGLLLAAPTVLDLEQGTHRLAWTQTVTRSRWLAMRIGFGLVTAVIVSAALIALWTWWREPFDAIEGRWIGGPFYLEGPVTFAHLVLTFAVCLAAGALFRRAIAAIGISFVVFLLVLMVVENVLRPRYMEPERYTFDPSALMPGQTHSEIRRGDHWVLSEGYTDASGDMLGQADPTVRSCAIEAESKGGDLFNTCLDNHGITFSFIYHPEDRFWIFQAIETALLLGVAALLFGLTYWWVTRRIAR